MKSKTLPGYCTSGRALEELGGVVVHYFSCQNVDVDNRYDMHACWNLFCDLNVPKTERINYMQESNWPAERMYASAHVLVGRSGEVWKLADFDKQTYHAGRSILNGKPNCNRWTIGVELVGGPRTGFTPEQYGELAKVCVDLGVGKRWIAGHDTVRHAAIAAGTATKKKNDPSGRSDGMGDNFDWDELYSRMDVYDESVTAP